MNERNILLVEDNDDDILLTTMAFQENKVANKIDIVRDGEEALDYLFARGSFSYRNKKEIPSILLLDLKLPKVDGFEVLRQIRADNDLKVIPVIILTSSKEEQDVINGYKLGANSFIRKPVNFEQFIDCVKQLNVYWFVLAELP